MKYLHVFLIFNLVFILFGCNLPVANSLLVDQSSSCDVFTGCTSTNTTTSSALDIQANSSAVSLNVDAGDMVEITGTCTDQGRKNNRILVQVFAGEDETADAYFDNTINDLCFPSVTPINNSITSGLESVFINPKNIVVGPLQLYTLSASGGVAPYTYTLVSGTGSVGAGTGIYTAPASDTVDIIQVTDSLGGTSRAIVSVVTGVTTAVASLDNKKCFSVTKGIGLVEDAGLPNEKTYPQCHNGQFGFSVRLGKILLNASSGQPNNKYLVRYKLRTDSPFSDSTWGRVTIDRNLTTPSITSADTTAAAQKCTIKSQASRFNPAIRYTLNRTFTDIVSTNAGSVNLFSNANTSVTTIGTSVFNWDDVGLTDGVTYNYTLSSTDLNYSYTPSAPVKTSSVVSCETARPAIDFLATPGTGACYLKLDSTKYQFNPYVTYEWGYSASGASWIGSGSANTGFTRAFSAGCICPGVATVFDPYCVAPYNPATCSESGLSNTQTYFFAVRTRNLVTGEIGKWSSNVLGCKPQ